jgi:hypothetical protein
MPAMIKLGLVDKLVHIFNTFDYWGEESKEIVLAMLHNFILFGDGKFAIVSILILKGLFANNL